MSDLTALADLLTARAASPMWCKLYAVVTKSNDAASHGNFSAFPSSHSIWLRPSRSAAARARKIAAVMSRPVICATCGANASVKVPGPHATSTARMRRIASAALATGLPPRTPVSSSTAFMHPRSISSSCAASAARTFCENAANSPAVRVNRSCTKSLCFLSLMRGMIGGSTAEREGPHWAEVSTQRGRL